MATLFTFCALIGGTFLLCQFVMTLIGLGHGGFDVDASHLPPDSLPGQGDDPQFADFDHDADGSNHHGSSWLFGIISFRTLVAATTFFGLAGMAALTGGLPLGQQLLIAVASGGGAMFAIHGLMRFLFQLGQSGTLRIRNAIGRTGTVAVPIPGKHGGQGRVRLIVQGRFEELAAVHTLEGTLTTGSQVVVLDVVDGNVLEVAPLEQSS